MRERWKAKIMLNLTLGTAALTCQASSSFDYPAPQCILNQCPNIHMESGVNGFTGGYVYNDVPQLSCSLGYHVIQTSTLR